MSPAISRTARSRAIFRIGLTALGLVALLALPGANQPGSEPLSWIRPSNDGRHFVRQGTDQRIIFWGFNYDRDDAGRLLEDYWDQEWKTVADDFHEMQALGANVVRVHLQLARFMTSPEQTNAANLARLGQLVRLAEDTGLYLDVTGLGCYHKQDVPEWYDALDESDRWAVQARFWKAVATVCKHSPAVFCYNLMNEPILAGEKPETDWLAGEFGGKHFVQRINLSLKGRTREAVAQAWVETLTSAIKEIDSRHMITLGVIPWAYTFKGAKPLFYAPEVGKSLDFVSVHFYPKADDLDGALAALKVYEVGKPLVVEEIFPLAADIKQTGAFIKKSQTHVDGWISFYWGKTIQENAREEGVKGRLISEWLTYFRDHSNDMKNIDNK